MRPPTPKPWPVIGFDLMDGNATAHCRYRASVLFACAAPPSTISWKLWESSIAPITQPKPIMPRRPAIAGARLALLLSFANRTDGDKYGKDARTPTNPPRDPEQKIPTIPPKATAPPRTLSNSLFRCRRKNSPMGMTMISNSPKESGVTKVEFARYRPFLKC